MYTNTIDELKQNKFTITKTRDIQTVVEHVDLFYVKGTAGEISAPFNDETGMYTVTFSGHPVNNQLSESILQHPMPLLASINATPVQSNEVDDQKTADETTKLQTKQFSELEDGAIFYRSADVSSAMYTKVDTSAFKRVGESIASSLELYARDTDQVFIVEMMDDFSTLTHEQKVDIVQHTPQGLSSQDFADHAAQEIDNIAGLESLTDDELSDLITELYTLYTR